MMHKSQQWKQALRKELISGRESKNPWIVEAVGKIVWEVFEASGFLGGFNVSRERGHKLGSRKGNCLRVIKRGEILRGMSENIRGPDEP